MQNVNKLNIEPSNNDKKIEHVNNVVSSRESLVVDEKKLQNSMGNKASKVDKFIESVNLDNVVARNNKKQIGIQKEEENNLYRANDFTEEGIKSQSLGERVMVEIERTTEGRVDLNDYLVVANLNAEEAMVVLGRIASNTGKNEMAKFIKELLVTGNANDKTFSEFIDDIILGVERVQVLRSDIEKEIESLDNIRYGDGDIKNIPIDSVFATLRNEKNNLQIVNGKSMAELFRLGAVAATIDRETFNDYFNRIEKTVAERGKNILSLLKYSVPALRKAMNRTVRSAQSDE